MSESPKEKPNTPNPFLGYETIAKIMEARDKHMARVERIEMEFNERLDEYTQKLYHVFQRADQVNFFLNSAQEKTYRQPRPDDHLQRNDR